MEAHNQLKQEEAAERPRTKSAWKNHVSKAFKEIKNVDVLSNIPTDIATPTRSTPTRSTPKGAKPEPDQSVLKTGMLQKRSRLRGKLSKASSFWVVLRRDEMEFYRSAGVRDLI